MAEENKNTKEITGKSKIAEKEEEILKFWQENKIFEKSLEKPAPNGSFVFFDGPPFATGLPHYGHILPGTVKDVIPRYQTMKGKRVARKWGWDCHGLPIENLIEKELGLSSKKDIEIFGVEKFNTAARKAVMRYADEWKKIIPRSGRWVDMEDDYKTMDTSYTESVWWAFKNLYDKGLIYKSFKSMHICPHCETTLSNFEINQGYKDITDISVYLKFAVTGEKDTYFLAWTTTPWTLPGNVALAINKNTSYVKVEKEKQFFILAKDLAKKVLKENYEIVEEFSGQKLLGKSYTPLFSYYKNDTLENRENGFKVYHGDFVTTTDGTGIVHIAPAFGEDDMNLGKTENLPFIQHVAIDGTFKKEVTDFALQKVKPKEDHQRADVEIIKFLAKAGTLFEKEKMIHSYPHCWRCETPLLNYATTSWFVKVSEIKDRMVEINKNISWNPKEIGEGRFGKWLEGARDWAISRSRYWGAPLPVWENADKELFVIESISELKKYTKKSGNKYFVMRHGEAGNNIEKVYHSDASNRANTPLTDKGRAQVKESIGKFKKNIDIVISSPYLRTKQTTEIVCEHLNFSSDKVVYDSRIYEWKAGTKFNGKSKEEFRDYYDLNYINNLQDDLSDGESFSNVIKRVGEFIYDIESKYQDKNIFIVAHSGIMRALNFITDNLTFSEVEKAGKPFAIPENATIREVSFIPLPHNENYELDLHRPYIDNIELVDKDGSLLKRVPEVFDCWFESGSMSFAQYHYPFENKEKFEAKNGSFFPADFIAEGLDQTRGWFYTMLVLGTGLFDKSPYNSVIVNGMILAEDGRKMSKSLNNYPDPVYIIDKYGADSLRYYLMSSPAVKGEDLNFSEKGVEEVVKKVFNLVSNILSFYDLYKSQEVNSHNKSTHILDRWIMVRLATLIKEGGEALDEFKVFEAARSIRDFVSDFSTWYIRRSRDRFKSEDILDRNNALATTGFVLLQMAKYMAPFMPFFAEDIYLKLKENNEPESVHLCAWPEAGEVSEEILKNMAEVRKVVSLALEKRMTANIKVRQPLNELRIKNHELKGKLEYLELIKDEVNVKSISFNEKLETEVELDTEITEALQKEGDVRGFIRAIQELRKNKNLMPSDVIELLVETDNTGRAFLDSVSLEIKKPTNINTLIFENNAGEEILVNEMKFKIKIK